MKSTKRLLRKVIALQESNQKELELTEIEGTKATKMALVYSDMYEEAATRTLDLEARYHERLRVLKQLDRRLHWNRFRNWVLKVARWTLERIYLTID